MCIPALFLALFALQTSEPDTEIRAILERLRTDDAAARRQALEELRRKGKEAVPAAISAIADNQDGLAERIDATVAQLSSTEWKKRDEAMKALAQLGRQARARLEEHASAPDLEVAWRVRAALAHIEAEEGREFVLECGRRAALCEFLGRMGDVRAVPPLFEVMTAPVESAGEVASAILLVRLRAIEALAELRDALSAEQARKVSERADELLLEAGDRWQTAIILRALGRLRQRAAALVVFVKDGTRRDVFLKKIAMRALAEIGEARGVAAIVEALSSDDAYFREAAIETISRMAGRDFGLDPMEDPARAREKIRAVHRWWEEKFGMEWKE